MRQPTKKRSVHTHTHTPTHTPTPTHTHTHTLTQLRLEEKQRSKRRKKEALAAKAAEAAASGHSEEAAQLERDAMYAPLWFKKEYDPLTNSMMHVYKGGYWEAKFGGDWKVDFPDIF